MRLTGQTVGGSTVYFVDAFTIDLFANTIAQVQTVECGALWDSYGSNFDHQLNHNAPDSKVYAHARVWPEYLRKGL